MQEVKVPNASYSKLVAEDGSVAVLLTGDYGGGWSTDTYDSIIKHKLMFDSRIALYVLSDEYKNTFTHKYVRNEKLNKDKLKKIYQDLMNDVFSDTDFDSSYLFSSFANLRVTFIPKDTLFRIDQYDGAESIVLFDQSNYFTA